MVVEGPDAPDGPAFAVILEALAVTGIVLGLAVVPEVMANIRTSVPGPNRALVSPSRTRAMYGS